MKARYIRISSGTQSTARQLAKQHPDEKLYIDIISGAVPFIEREAASELIRDITNGTIKQVSFSSIDRCGRNAFDIQFTLNWFMQAGCNVKIDNLGIESILPNGKPNSIFGLISSVLANVSAMEREALLERQAEGIKLAKARGVYSKSRNKPSMTESEVLAKYPTVVKELKLGNNSLRKVAKLAGVSLGTVQKVKEALETKKGNQ